MDEDYDACDLENWFLAIQSADGQVIVPSFHRSGIIRYDPQNGVNDWARTNPSGNWSDSAARILRPVAAGDRAGGPFRVNVATLSPAAAKAVGLGGCLLLGCVLLVTTRCHFAVSRRA